ncbi:EAL domain-containing protein, partial [Roseobacter sp.]|uniref:EAL domain-containing protein n=1 Tax=Roseobacter sp. TaxID=1907202 RepID=UPI0032982D65
FLRGGIATEDQSAILKDALARRKEDLPQTWAALSAGFGWDGEVAYSLDLVDRPASPERGQLLTALLQSGVRDTEVLSFYGLDLSYAYAHGLLLPDVSAQAARLAYADLSYSQMLETDFGGASLTGARLRNTFLKDVSFASVPGSEIRPPYSKDLAFYNTNMAGVDFHDAHLLRPDFSNIDGLAVQFDGATLVEPQFQDARISAGTFRGTVLLAPEFVGTDLRSVDFDGAIIDGADALDRIAAEAAEGSFQRARFEQSPITLEDALQVTSLYTMMGYAIDLDDFGTGHASISSMRRLPITRLKVDRSFVTHIDSDPEQQRMIAAIVTMAERLGLDTLAEGVEHAGEHAMLSQLGCRHVQGFGIA